MILATRKRGWSLGTSDSPLPKVECVEAGRALVLHLENHLDPRVLTFARMIAPDPEHTMVVADLPPGGPVELWHSVARLLGRRRGGYRVVLGRHSRDAAVMTGQWLAERLNCPVVVPDGDVVMGHGGTLFSSALRGRGWVRFRRGRDPQQDSRRFPAPDWTSAGTEDVWRPGPVSIVEPLPAGVWIRPLASADAHRRLVVSGLSTAPEVLTVVLGAPNSRPIPLGEIARFCQSIPPENRERLRFVQYGPVEVLRSSAGQSLADQLGASVTFYVGMPMPDGTLRVVTPNGRLGWRSFARELRYQPRIAADRAMPPQLLAHDNPMPGVAEMSPGVYWYTVDSVVEVIQSGLWLRPSVLPMNADEVRTAPTDARHATVVFDTTSWQSAERMQRLARELVTMLDPAVQRMFRVLPASAFLSTSPAASAAGMVVDSVPAKWSGLEDSGAPAQTTGVELSTAQPLSAALPTAAEHPALSAAAAIEAPVPTETVVVGPAGAPEPTLVLESRTATYSPTPTNHPASETVLDGSGQSQAVEPKSETAVPSKVSGSARIPDAAMPIGMRLESAVPDFNSITDPPVPSSASTPESEQESEESIESTVPSTHQAIRVQPVPEAAACAVPPSRGLAEERVWLRKTLSAQYDIAASTVSRMLSQIPGLRVGMQADSVLADLVAVRLYLTGDSSGLDDAVRSAQPGPHVPMARVVTSGLKRLPSHRGATQLLVVAGAAELDWYRDRVLVSEWAFLTATTTGRAARPDEVEFRIWSMTARRTQLIKPDRDNQVLFLPGTNFKVLDVRDEPSPVVLLRELSSAEIDDDGGVNTGRSMFDDLALGGLDRAARAWTDQEGADRALPTAGAPPGLLPRATEGTNP